LAYQEATGITKGDNVMVKHKCPSYLGGWNNSWTEEMNDAVGREFIVIDVNGTSGVSLKGSDYSFPVFCLVKKEAVIEIDGREWSVSTIKALLKNHADY
jgi:hypothetical protein